MPEQLSDRLIQTLRQRGISQKELADRSGVTQASVSHYLKGDRVPNAATLSRLADALGTSPDYLLFGDKFTEGDRLAEAADMVARCAGYLTREQKLAIIKALVDC